MTHSPYLNEPIVLLLRDQLSEAMLTAQAMAENAVATGEELPPIVALAIHQQLVELETCIHRSIRFDPAALQDPFDDPLR